MDAGTLAQTIIEINKKTGGGATSFAKPAGPIGSMKWEGGTHAQDQMQRALLLTVKWDRYAPAFERRSSHRPRILC